MAKTILAALCCLLASPALAVNDVDTLNVNRWGVTLTNFGPFGNPGWWRMRTHTYLFGCGPWFGALGSGDTLVSLGYDPNAGTSELTPGDSLGNGADVRIYRWPDDWPPPQGRFPNAPRVNRSHGDRWTLFNDLDSARHISPGRPLGLQAWLTVYAWWHPSAQDFVYLQYEFANVFADTLRGCYAGVVCDYDIGAATDDGFGAFYQRRFVRGPGDTLLLDHMAFGYDCGYTGWDTVGAIGLLLAQTPRSIGVSAIKRFTIDIDPVTDPAQYLTLAGYDYRTGEYAPFDTTEVPTPSDKRFLVACGPFDLAPGAVDTITVALIACPFWPDTLHLAECARAADSLYPLLLSGVVQEPERPSAGRLSATPNPFRGAVRFSAPAVYAGPLTIRDVTGRVLRRLDCPPAGVAVWDGRDAAGAAVPPGVYFAASERDCLKLVRD